MKQIFILGASSVYGVGAEQAGWGDLVKSYVHNKMYGPDGTGEICEVFNFSKAGSTVEFVAQTFPWICENYQRTKELTILVSVGGNDARAKDTPEGYACSPEAFKDKVTNLANLLKDHAKNVIFVSNGYVDESKVNPKPSPFDNSVSYFTNQRRSQFNAITKEICQSLGIDFVAVDCNQDVWIKNYLYKDGLHPNQAGYELVFQAVKPKVDHRILNNE